MNLQWGPGRIEHLAADESGKVSVCGERADEKHTLLNSDPTCPTGWRQAVAMRENISQVSGDDGPSLCGLCYDKWRYGDATEGDVR